MPWNNTTKMMSLPIGMGDIAAAVGYASGDLGTLIRNGVINKFSKFKPVGNGALDYSSQMNSGRTEWASGATWWKGSNGHCGLSIQEFTDLGSISTASAFLYKLKNEQLPWNYERPQGTVGSQPYRALDFFRYKGDAEPPVGALAATDIWLDNNYAGQFDWDTAAADAYTLGLGDILLNNQAMTNYYLGVLLWKGSTYYIITSSSKFVAGGSISVPFTGAQSLVGSWYMVPFISSRQYSIGSSYQSGIYASLFGIGNTEIILHAPGTIVDLTVFAVWNSAGTAIDYELYITNNGASTQNLTGVGIQLRTTTSGSQAPASGDLVKTVNVGSLSVPGKESISRMGTITGLSRNQSLIYWIQGYADGHTNSQYQQIEEPEDQPE
ncbi:MAG: hypothetical protein IJU63_08955 [Bacteroidales bacterium]|nr:hypothetical protein [Bacteroidales bacterium]